MEGVEVSFDTQGTDHLTYQSAGVDARRGDDALKTVLERLRGTWGPRGNVELDFGHFANVVTLGPVGVAISTDSIGTKAIVAQLMGRYDTVGIDCVAINVNDVLCVGAEPQAMVDYIAVQQVNPPVLDGIAKGLAEGALMAGISIVGGESAQLPELIQGEDEGSGFDLAGTCIGTITPGAAITGSRIHPGDVIIGLTSSGIHCNGLTLARAAFGITRDKASAERRDILSKHYPELGSSLGEELLRPTRIYVAEVMAMLTGGVDVRGIAHITRDGFLNLPRLQADVGYVIDYLPEPHPIFRIVQARGSIPDPEMFFVFNMGIGLCLIVPEADGDTALRIAIDHGADAYAIGHVTEDVSRAVDITGPRLRGRRGEGFQRIS